MDFPFSAQVAAEIGIGLVFEERGGMLDRSVGERVMVAFDDVVEFDAGAVVARDREPDGVGSLAAWESGAGSAGVSEVAERLEDVSVRLARLIGHGAAQAFPQAAQRQHGVCGTTIVNVGGDRVEVGASHSGGIVARGAGRRPRYSRDQWQAHDWKL
jgi:hypothetical protein